MRVPDKLRITVEVGGQPAGGMLVQLKFLAAKKNSFDFAFGPSDKQGTIEISRDQILLEARKTIDLFPMDYWNIEVDLDWRGARHPNEQRIVRARPESISLV